MARRILWVFEAVLLSVILLYTSLSIINAQSQGPAEQKMGITLEEIQLRRGKRVTQPQREAAAERFKAMQAQAAKAALLSAGQVSNTTTAINATVSAPSETTEGGAK